MMGYGTRKLAGDARNRLIAAVCAVVVLGMVGMAYAAVPLYDLFCRVTGYGGTTQIAERAGAIVGERSVRVRFDANVHNLDVAFRPQRNSVHVRLGEAVRVQYVAENRGDRPVTVTSTFNVTPPASGAYFNKIECFCFTEHVLGPQERLMMPVEFFVDPAMGEDGDLDHVGTITLSYTMIPGESPSTALSQAALTR